MRPIKFRAQTLDGIWFKWDLFSKIQMRELKEAIKEETVGQFTGLFDRNGTEIYEGDILATADEQVLVDNTEPTGDFIELRTVNDYEYFGGERGTRHFGRPLSVVRWSGSTGFEPFCDSEGNCGHCGGGERPEYFEVIGNIYEHPDLITKTNTDGE